MAGSYRHVTDGEGRYIGTGLLDHMGDASEALEQCVAMIRYLAGGDKRKIYEAWLYGFVFPNYPHADPTDPVYSYERFWGET